MVHQELSADVLLGTPVRHASALEAAAQAKLEIAQRGLGVTVTKKYSLSPCDGPSGLAIDTKARRLFSVCSNRVMAISDPDAGRVVATPAIGANSDGAAFDPGTGYAMSSNGDGTLTIVAQTGGKWDVVENIATERGARTIAVDEKTHKVYLPTAKTVTSASGGSAKFLPNTFKVLIVGK